MAFNFNWSPLTADADFYKRAQEMLTTALNKSPKPPIIVDDILVNELNLGSVPPDLEILEIGDLAEDRFRGIFKMCYSGDAFLTLQTRVQANPMNTYLSSKPSFTSPQPLAASSGLTIPLQITLSQIKLSAFIILVFSRQKGLTLVFRNDPLESMKVSSTFDSIPFVSEYLQKTIEGQVRTLMMEELPAIIHRLSLRLWCPEYAAKEEEERKVEEARKAQESETDPLATPPLDAVDWSGNPVPSDISELSLEEGLEGHSLFSQKNLLRMGVLSDSQRTLSLFTPSIREAVFRAWAGPAEKELNGITGTASMPPLTRTTSHVSNGATTYTFSDQASESGSLSSRPSMVHLQSATTGLSLGSGARRQQGRKKKHRVVNLRKKALRPEDSISEAGESASETVSETSSVMGGSEPIMSSQTMASSEPVHELAKEEVPAPTATKGVRFSATRGRGDSIDLGDMPHTLRHIPRAINLEKCSEGAVTSALANVLSGSQQQPVPSVEIQPPTPQAPRQETKRPVLQRTMSPVYGEKGMGPSISYVPYEMMGMNGMGGGMNGMGQGGIIEQAWMMSMAAELARRAHVRKQEEGMEGFEMEGRDETPPPAYGA